MIQSPYRKSGLTPQRASEGSQSEGRQAERYGEPITRRIAPDGATRKGADVSLVIDPQDVVKALKPEGNVRCSTLHTSLLVTP
jgi:hypothetical protein